MWCQSHRLEPFSSILLLVHWSLLKTTSTTEALSAVPNHRKLDWTRHSRVANHRLERDDSRSAFRLRCWQILNLQTLGTHELRTGACLWRFAPQMFLVASTSIVLHTQRCTAVYKNYLWILLYFFSAPLHVRALICEQGPISPCVRHSSHSCSYLHVRLARARMPHCTARAHAHMKNLSTRIGPCCKTHFLWAHVYDHCFLCQ